MQRTTKIALIVMHYEEAQEQDYRERGRPWKWRTDDLRAFRQGCESATDEHLDALLIHWRARSNPAARRATDRAVQKYQDKTAPHWGDLGPKGALQ